MRTFIRVAAVTTLLLPLQPNIRAAQSTAGSPDPPVDAATKQRVIDGAIEHLKNAYIFFDVADKMAAAIRERAARNEYDAITGSRAFADALTTQLQEVSKDKHLRVLFNAEGFPERRTPTAEERERMRAAERRDNYGFQRVERLDGNVGYIDLHGFSGSPDAGPTAVAAMNFAAGTDALLFDLRANGGGSPAMIGLLSSFGIWVPNGRAINPITKTNWEGTGIEPDIKVPSADALKTAHLDALQKLRTTATDSRHQQELDRSIATLKEARQAGVKRADSVGSPRSPNTGRRASMESDRLRRASPRSSPRFK